MKQWVTGKLVTDFNIICQKFLFDTEQNYASNNVAPVFLKESALVPPKHLQNEASPDQYMGWDKAGWQVFKTFFSPYVDNDMPWRGDNTESKQQLLQPRFAF